MRRFLRLPTRIPVRLPSRQVGQKWLAAVVIALAATVLSFVTRETMFISIPMGRFDDLLYDSMYLVRKQEDRKDGPVVIVAIGPADLQRLRDQWLDDRSYPWPWPREFYGAIVEYLDGVAQSRRVRHVFQRSQCPSAPRLRRRQLCRNGNGRKGAGRIWHCRFRERQAGQFPAADQAAVVGWCQCARRCPAGIRAADSWFSQPGLPCG